MENVFENFVISVLKLYRIVQKIKNYEMSEYGLKSVHVMCLYFLSANEEGLASNELARLTLEDKAAISRAIGQLREKNFVEYDAGKYNAPVRLTEEGKQIAEAVLGKANRAVDAGSVDFTEEERVTFYKSLGEIATKLNEYYDNLIKE
ncbi:MAG: MarR family transcriptional regulator [Clostridia bacterium]|nr:MarR family transcriptional regulator [Clostridia bacterium]